MQPKILINQDPKEVNVNQTPLEVEHILKPNPESMQANTAVVSSQTQEKLIQMATNASLGDHPGYDPNYGASPIKSEDYIYGDKSLFAITLYPGNTKEIPLNRNTARSTELLRAEPFQRTLEMLLKQEYATILQGKIQTQITRRRDSADHYPAVTDKVTEVALSLATTQLHDNLADALNLKDLQNGTLLCNQREGRTTISISKKQEQVISRSTEDTPTNAIAIGNKYYLVDQPKEQLILIFKELPLLDEQSGTEFARAASRLFQSIKDDKPDGGKAPRIYKQGEQPGEAKPLLILRSRTKGETFLANEGYKHIKIPYNGEVNPPVDVYIEIDENLIPQEIQSNTLRSYASIAALLEHILDNKDKYFSSKN